MMNENMSDFDHVKSDLIIPKLFSSTGGKLFLSYQLLLTFSKKKKILTNFLISPNFTLKHVLQALASQKRCE